MTSIVTRSQWGAPHARYARISTPTGILALHHSVTPQWVGVKAPQSLERIARERGFNGISYNFVVTVDGGIFEGRGAGVVGAHTRGYNSSAHAICLVGDFDVDKPPEAMLDAVARLVRHGHKQGWWPERITHGHRQLGQTACPGRHAFAAITDINRRATTEQEHVMDARQEERIVASLTRIEARLSALEDEGGWLRPAVRWIAMKLGAETRIKTSGRELDI